MRLTWEFRRRHQVLRAAYWLWWCRIGAHDLKVWYYPDGRVEPTCEFCGYTCEPTENERNRRIPFVHDQDGTLPPAEPS